MRPFFTVLERLMSTDVCKQLYRFKEHHWFPGPLAWGQKVGSLLGVFVECGSLDSPPHPGGGEPDNLSKEFFRNIRTHFPSAMNRLAGCFSTFKALKQVTWHAPA